MNTDPNEKKEQEQGQDEMSPEIQLWRWGGEDEPGSMAYRNKQWSEGNYETDNEESEEDE